MRRPKVFLDSSVLIAALLSPTGGASHLLSTFGADFSFQINQYVLEEVVRILDQKFPEREVLKQKLFLLLGLVPISILPNPPGPEVKAAARRINEEDAPVLASALCTAPTY